MIDQSKILLAFKDFLAQEGASTKTQKNYCADIEDYVRWFDRNTRGKAIFESTRQDIDNYVGENLQEQKTIATINRRLSSLRVFFRYLVDAGSISATPMTDFSNLLDPNKTITEHKEILSSWQIQLKVKGSEQRAIDEQTKVVTHFLHWMKERSQIA